MYTYTLMNSTICVCDRKRQTPLHQISFYVFEYRCSNSVRIRMTVHFRRTAFRSLIVEISYYIIWYIYEIQEKGRPIHRKKMHQSMGLYSTYIAYGNAYRDVEREIHPNYYHFACTVLKHINMNFKYKPPSQLVW